MRADFTIGNVVIDTLEDSDEDIAYTEYILHIQRAELPEAPHFAYDNLTRNTNFRSMSIGASGRFFTDHGLDDFCQMFHVNKAPVKITQAMADMFTAARERHEAAIGEKVPGWPSVHTALPVVQPDGDIRWATEAEMDEAIIRENVDPDLARLMWFEWWLKWALANCEHPAISWT